MSIIAEVNMVASRLLGDDLVGGEMVWCRDDRKPRDCRYVRAWRFSSDEPSLVFQLLPL